MSDDPFEQSYTQLTFWPGMATAINLRSSGPGLEQATISGTGAPATARRYHFASPL
jgi:hypothetical protein